MPDWDNTESRERDEDAAWRDLVARYDTPLTTQQPVPWPEREDVPGKSPGTREVSEAAGADEAHGDGGSSGANGADGADGDSGSSGGNEADGNGSAQHRLPGETELAGTREADGTRGTGGAYGGPSGFGADGTGSTFDSRFAETLDPDVIQTPRVIRGPGARRAAGRHAAEDDEEHYIPPVPPPLPKLDPLAKGAWAALFGGPGYLVVATAAGWSVSGLAAFCAVAAFVAGFAILVLRMNGPQGPGGPDDGDDGAVV